MAVTILAWLLSLGVHVAFALFMLMPAEGTALEQGSTSEDIMVIERGIAIEGFARLGEDLVTVEEILDPPAELAIAQPLPEEKPQEVKPIEEQQVVASEAGPEQINVKEPEEVEEREIEEVEEPIEEPEVIEQPLPQQMASIEQQTVVAMRESSGEEQLGGQTTTHTAYLGALRNHLEKHKVNPRTSFIGTAIVEFTVGPNGEIAARKIKKSSGSKVLDEAALASIDKAVPFPPIPGDLHRSALEVTVPFRFTVR